MRNPDSFWDKLAERYSKKPVADKAAYQKNWTSRAVTSGPIWR